MSNAHTNVSAYDVIANAVQFDTDGSREAALRSFYTAVRATSLVILLMLSLLFVTALFATQPAHAQQICGERSAVLKHFAGRYSEKPQAMGLSSDGKLIEILVSSKGSWTILISSPDKQSCLAATGENWELNLDTVFGPPA